MIFKHYFHVYETRIEKSMVLNPCYIVVDRDGDFVDACSGRLNPSALDHVLENVRREFPENGPFRIIRWNGREFVELSPVT